MRSAGVSNAAMDEFKWMVRLSFIAVLVWVLFVVWFLFFWPLLPEIFPPKRKRLKAGRPTVVSMMARKTRKVKPIMKCCRVAFKTGILCAIKTGQGCAIKSGQFLENGVVQ
jgi:hypothetical protein